jgi:hypothetical protein
MNRMLRVTVTYFQSEPKPSTRTTHPARRALCCVPATHDLTRDCPSLPDSGRVIEHHRAWLSSLLALIAVPDFDDRR